MSSQNLLTIKRPSTVYVKSSQVKIAEKVREISTTSFLCAWRHIQVYLKCERVDVTAAEHAAEHFVACDRGRC